MEIYPEIEDYEVLSSGTIITVPGKKITFKIRDIIFELSFENNNDLSDHKISFEIPEGTKIMKILFENFNNSLGMGNTVPLPLGNIDNKSLFFNYRIYALDENLGKTLNYTWYLGKKEGGQDGK
ncbi:MAG: hypothetical protein KBB37_04940 [Bacteroidia bacterium]|jgi:hypothetical protein|nr:hypothetical protein [Bacteroidia bacterium]MBP9179874.1 hypothetical protein [Bacteroidia bacterium]MBP9724236.1 hypothetical protein [Bacteroidia bacterium]